MSETTEKIEPKEKGILKIDYLDTNLQEQERDTDAIRDKLKYKKDTLIPFLRTYSVWENGGYELKNLPKSIKQYLKCYLTTSNNYALRHDFPIFYVNRIYLTGNSYIIESTEWGWFKVWKEDFDKNGIYAESLYIYNDSGLYEWNYVKTDIKKDADWLLWYYKKTIFSNWR